MAERSTASSDPLSQDEERVIRLAARGRQNQAQRAFALLLGVVGVGAMAVGSARLFGPSTGAPGATWAGVVAATIVVLLLAAFLARRTAASIEPQLAASDPTASAAPTSTGDEHDGRTRTKAVICCSGGGVKSASFCMGALQRLEQETALWRAVDSIVGVSGGGYMASAWTAAAHRRGTGLVADPGSADLGSADPGSADRGTAAEPGSAKPGSADRRSADPWSADPWSADRLQALRARTNYLASSGRARFDLTCSILFGIVLNVLLLAAPLITIAWLVGGYAVDTGLATSPQTLTWTNWWVFTPSLFLVIVAVAIFLGKRFGWGAGEAPSRVQQGAERVYWRVVTGRATGHAATSGPDRLRADDLVRGPGHSRASARSGASDRSGAGDDSERLRFLSEAPNTLVAAAVGYAIAVPLLIWTAKHYTDVFREGSHLIDYLYANKDKITWGLAALAAMAGLSHSGAKSSAAAAGPLGTAWRILRRQVAPWLALLIIAAFAYWAAALLTAREMRTPLTGWWAVGAGAAIVVLPALVGLIGSANATSIFMFYRDRLAYAYLGPAVEDSNASSAPSLSPADLSLATLAGAESGGAGPSASVCPRLVLMATANAFGAGSLPTGRNGTPFLLSGEVGYPGSTGPYPKATQAASAYALESRRSITVAEAMAISGAAVSPQAGRESKNLGGYRVLLALANVRLGVWAPNPYFDKLAPATDESRWRRACLSLNTILDRHTALHVVQEAFGALRLDRPYIYLTDGGHYDNLGLVEALRRRPARIYVLDGTGDAEDSFAAVGDAIATARMDLGVEVTFPSPDLLTRGSKQYPAQAWTTMRATVPNDDEWSCEIIYIKAILPEGFTFDLYAFQERNPGFPTELGRIEMLDEFDFEAYRQLGWCATNSALQGLAGSPAA